MEFNPQKLLYFWQALEVGFARVNISGGGGGEFGIPAYPELSDGRNIDFFDGIRGVSVSAQTRRSPLDVPSICITAMNDGEPLMDLHKVEIGDDPDLDVKTTEWLIRVWEKITEAFTLIGKGGNFSASVVPYFRLALENTDNDLLTAIFGSHAEG